VLAVTRVMYKNRSWVNNTPEAENPENPI